MKALLPAILIACAAVFLVAYNPSEEKAPAGALEKIKAALPAEAYAKPEKPRKLLVFSKTNGFRHKSIPTGKLAVQLMGEQTGAYEAVISDDLANFEKEKIQEFDAICFLNTTMEVFSPFKEEMKKMTQEEKDEAEVKRDRLQANLMEFIKGGGGFVGIHAATDTFYKWPEYGEMMNGYFNGHPWNSDDQVSIFVEPGKEAHPFTEMFGGERIEFKEEIYQFKEPYDSSKVEMLLRLDPEKSDDVKNKKREDNDYGVAWAKNWGEGRVFYCSLGHNHHIYWNDKILKHYLAGIQWAAGDYKVELAEGK